MPTLVYEVRSSRNILNQLLRTVSSIGLLDEAKLRRVLGHNRGDGGMYRGGLPERLTAKHTAQPHGHSVLTSIITFSGKHEGSDVVYCTSP